MSFSEKDLNQIQAKGLTVEVVERQLENFQTGFPFVNIAKPATLQDGISPLDMDSAEEYAEIFEKKCRNLRLTKFTPASGAATRMFKHLFEYFYVDSSKPLTKLQHQFFESLSSFAFYPRLKSVLEKNSLSLEKLLENKEYHKILGFVLFDQGLNYGQMPKGLIEFHVNSGQSRTSLEEHFREGAAYACGANREVNLHFTVSPEHKSLFTQNNEEIKIRLEKELNVHFNISFSIQKESTDTIAVEDNLSPFRDENGSLLFRPGGHGALIENLNDIRSDLIFIKNIDNVCVDELKPITVLYKKAIAGLLLDYERKIHNYLDLLELDSIHESFIEQINAFVEDNLCVLPYDRPANKEEHVYWLKQKLNRPIRVCGMVRNEGKPGGGPFWTINDDHSISLQIVEQAQINTENPVKKEMLENSTHFNPVDIVCSTKDYKGNHFDLRKFIDHKAGFITRKTKAGRSIIAQEKPGLWNGAMSNWNTIFVEVPIETFNPVKNVNDLLNSAHQKENSSTSTVFYDVKWG